MNLTSENRRHRPFFWLAKIAALGLVILLATHHFAAVPTQPESTSFLGYFDFKFKSKDLQKVSRPWRYTWYNSGTVASVEHICKNIAGKGKLMVFDGAGNQVYSRALGDNGAYLTEAGTAGEWTIQVVFENETN